MLVHLTLLLAKFSLLSEWLEFIKNIKLIYCRNVGHSSIGCHFVIIKLPWPILVTTAIISDQPKTGISVVILLHDKFLQFVWLRAVVFQLNLKYLHVYCENYKPFVGSSFLTNNGMICM